MRFSEISLVVLSFCLLASIGFAADRDLWHEANQAYSAGDENTGNQRLKELIEQNPGDHKLATRCLLRIANAGRTVQGRLNSQWERYVHDGLLALERLGAISREREPVRLALEHFLANGIKQGRPAEVIEELDRLVLQNPEDLDWRLAQAKAYRTLSLERAPELFAALERGIDLNHPDEETREAWRRFAEELQNNHHRFHAGINAVAPGEILGIMEIQDPDGLWGNLRGNPARWDRAALDRLFANSAAAVQALWWQDHSGILDPAHAVDLHLRAQDPRALPSLRRMQTTRAVQAEVNAAKSARAVLQLSRRYPWSLTVHARLLELANEDLWMGRPAAATRSFRFLLDHSAHKALRARAQVGLWLAAGDVPDEVTGNWPWMGTEADAATIRARLRSQSTPEAKPRPLAELTLNELSLPDVAPWSTSPSWASESVDIQPIGDALLLSSRNLLMSLDANSQPRWQRLRRNHRDDHRYARYHPGYFRPLVAQGRVYTRWGQYSEPNSLAAFDHEGGRMLWNHRVSHDRRKLPLSNPVFVDGNLLYLQWNQVHTNKGHKHLLSLVAYDPHRQALSWERDIGFADEQVDVSRFKKPMDRAAFGNRLTVAEGSIYSNSNLGMVARSDARDGRTDWVHFYRHSPSLRPHISLGAEPLIHGNLVIFAPRDSSRVFALDRETGRLVWDNPLVLPVELMGLVDGTVLIRGLRNLVGLDAATGKQRWASPLLREPIGRVQRIGDTLYLADAQALHRIDARSGHTLESQPWELGGRALSFHIQNARLHVVTDKPHQVDQRATVANSATLDLPLREAWALHRPHAKVQQIEGFVFIATGGLLECIEAETMRIRWRRLLSLREPRLLVSGQSLIAVERADWHNLDRPDRAKIIDLTTGELRTNLNLEASYDRMLPMGDIVLLHDARSYAAALDPVAGRLLWEQQFSAHNIRPYWDGKQLNILQTGFHRTPVALRVDPRSGVIVEKVDVAFQRPPAENEARKLEDGYYEVTFAPKTGRYVRFTTINDVGPNGWASGAEMQVLGDGQRLDRSGWTGKTSSYERSRNTKVEHLWDNNSGSYWHTPWVGGIPRHPHWVQIDTGAEHPINGFQYLPARIINQNGTVALYELHVSSDGKEWGEPVAKGPLVRRMVMRRMELCGDQVYVEVENTASRERDVYRYKWGEVRMHLVARDAEVFRPAGAHYMLLRKAHDGKAPMTAVKASDPDYRFVLEGMRADDQLVASGRYLVSNREQVIVADLEARSIATIEDPSGEDKRRGGWGLLTGEHELLRLVNFGGQGQAIQRFNLKEKTSDQMLVTEQHHQFERIFHLRHTTWRPQVDRVLVLYDKTRLTAWIADKQ